jgi:hypothetical protein
VAVTSTVFRIAVVLDDIDEGEQIAEVPAADVFVGDGLLLVRVDGEVGSVQCCR